MPVLQYKLRGLPPSGYEWSMERRVFLIGAVFCPLRNIPPVSASSDEVATFFCVCKTVRMGPFSFFLGVSVGGG